MAHSGPRRLRPRKRLATDGDPGPGPEYCPCLARSRGQCPGSGSAVTLGARAAAVPGPASAGPRNNETLARHSQQTGTRGSSTASVAGPRTRTRLRPLCRSRSQIPLLCDSPSSETHGLLQPWSGHRYTGHYGECVTLWTGAVTSHHTWSRVTCYELGCEIVTRVTIKTVSDDSPVMTPLCPQPDLQSHIRPDRVSELSKSDQ